MIVDLRSDTVTRPTKAMREAMAWAEVGDDVFGDDPTVNALEARAAALAGKEAALFVASGTMGNQIAIRLHTHPGDEVLMETKAHPYNYEAGAAAAVSGVQIRLLATPDGLLTPDIVRAALRPENVHFAPASLLCVEDTTNRGGGGVYPLEALDALCEAARDFGLACHLDGARVFNAVVASGIPLARRLRGSARAHEVRHVTRTFEPTRQPGRHERQRADDKRERAVDSLVPGAVVLACPCGAGRCGGPAAVLPLVDDEGVILDVPDVRSPRVIEG